MLLLSRFQTTSLSGQRWLGGTWEAIPKSLLPPCSLPAGGTTSEGVCDGHGLALLMLAAALAGAAVSFAGLLGFVGLPVFSNYMGGAERLAGPTGGYLVGYLPMVFLAGTVSEWSFRRLGDGEDKKSVALAAILQFWGWSWPPPCCTLSAPPGTASRRGWSCKRPWPPV